MKLSLQPRNDTEAAWMSSYEEISEPSELLAAARLHALRTLTRPSEIATVVLLKTDLLMLLNACEGKPSQTKIVHRLSHGQLSLFPKEPVRPTTN